MKLPELIYLGLLLFYCTCYITFTGPSLQNDAKNGNTAPLTLHTRPVIKYDKKEADASHRKIQELADLAVKFASELTKEAIAKYFMPELVVEDTVYPVEYLSNSSNDDGKSVYSVKTTPTQKVSLCEIRLDYHFYNVIYSL